eukprot:UN15840
MEELMRQEWTFDATKLEISHFEILQIFMNLDSVVSWHLLALK